MQQLQLHLAIIDRIELAAIVEEQLVELMAQMLLAVTAPESEEGRDDREP
jgi:hypothetical protein